MNDHEIKPEPIILIPKSEDVQFIGTTLMDQFAIAADISEFHLASINELSFLLGRVIDENDAIDILKAGIEAQAKLKYLFADAMMKEREKYE